MREREYIITHKEYEDLMDGIIKQNAELASKEAELKVLRDEVAWLRTQVGKAKSDGSTFKRK